MVGHENEQPHIFLLIESSPRTNVGEIEENDERKKISHFYGEVH